MRYAGFFGLGILLTLGFSVSMLSAAPAAPRNLRLYTGASAWPDATNTGYKNAADYPGHLTTFTGTIQSNHTYNFMDFSGGASVGTRDAYVSNVTFHGCRFHGSSTDGALVILYGDNLTFDYSSFEPEAAAPPVSHTGGYQYGLEGNGGYYSVVQQLTVTNCDFWGFADAVDVGGSTQAKPQVYRNNYLHDERADGGQDHTDGIGQLDNGPTTSYVVIDHNTIIGLGNTQAIAYQYGPYDHFTVTRNYLSGYGYTICIGGYNGPSNIAFTDNVWGTDFQQAYGAWYSWGGSGNTWRRNKLHYVNPIRQQGDDSNSYVFQPSDNSKFWTPSGISTTDYTGP